MAFYGGFLSEEQLMCSICLEVFTNPVTTPCGHNFCKTCLTGYWNSSDHCQCPLCNKSFETRPDMSVNTLISETASQLKPTEVNTTIPTKKPTSASANVLCDACTGVKRSSVKSCLNCGASYCDIHLQPHLNIPNLKKHKLINPVEKLEDYICQKHDRPLELFCRDDETCVCQFCIEGEHKNHKAVPIQEANQEIKACVKKTQTEVQRMSQERIEKTVEIENSLQLSKTSIEEEVKEAVAIFTALIRCIERSQAELIEEMEEKQTAIERRAEELIQELEQEITLLKRKDVQLDQLSNAENCLQKIQICTAMCRPTHAKNWTQISINTDLSRKTWKKSLSHLHKELNDEMNKEMTRLKKRSQQNTDGLLHLTWIQLLILMFLCLVPCLVQVTKAFWIQVYSVDLTLDPDTANGFLFLSEDGKQVKSNHHSWNHVPYNQKRFHEEPYVLAKESFASGRFYYEVHVAGKTNWDLGVAKASVSRSQYFYPAHNEKTWTMIKRDNKNYWACANSCVRLQLSEEVETVGVFVDYEEGLLTFYDAKARSHIYSITAQTFTEQLFPIFSPGENYGVNSTPLIIGEVNEYLIKLRRFFSSAKIWH